MLQISTKRSDVAPAGRPVPRRDDYAEEAHVAQLVALVRAAQSGDGQALDELVQSHLTIVYNIVGRALSGHADVDDVVQDTMLRAVRGLPDLRDPARFRSWLVSIAYRRVQQHYRSRRLRVVPWTESCDVPDPGGDFAQRTVDELVLSGQRKEIVAAARWLEAGDRQLLSLWWLEAAGRLTRAELADALGQAPAHVAVRVKRMKAKLEDARLVVRALAAVPPCPALSAALRGWDGSAGPLWRKRLNRHVRSCAACSGRRVVLVAPEQLLLGIGLAPVPLGLVQNAAATVPAVAGFAGAAGSWLLGQTQRVIEVAVGKVAAATTVAAVGVAGAGWAVGLTVDGPASDDRGVLTVAPVPSPPEPRDIVGEALATGPVSRPASTGRAGTDADTASTRHELFVAPTGSDDAAGTAAEPLGTLAKAVSVVRPGQTIVLGGGTHVLRDPIVVTTRGRADARITLRSKAGERAVIDASELPPDRFAITQRVSFWTVRDLEIKGARSYALVCVSCREVSYQRLRVHDSYSGVSLRGPGTVDNSVLDSDLYANRSDDGEGGVGLAFFSGDGRGNVVRGNRFFDNAKGGLDLGGFGDPVTVDRNWAFGNGGERWGSDVQGNGFTLGGGAEPPVGHVLRHNAAWDNSGRAFTDDGNAGRLVLDHNTAFRNRGGFVLESAAAILRGNVAESNDDDLRFGPDVEERENSWNRAPDADSVGLDAFGTVEAAVAEGARPRDGGLPRSAFLVRDDGFGAVMAR